MAAAGALGAAEQKPFSHRAHLRLKLACASCHAGAPASTAVADNNLPAEKFCRTCHPDGRTIKTPRATNLAKFNHALHVKLGNIAPLLAAAMDKGQYLSPRLAPQIRPLLNVESKVACTGCHRGLEQSDSVTPANFPAMADCLVCHNKVDNPFSCEKCHAANANLKPASHTKDYIDVHSTGKANLDKATCTVCHGRAFSCLGCHSGA
jgi:hypothetical protein